MASSVSALLQMVLALLLAVQNNPNASPAATAQAISAATQVIAYAQQSVASTPTTATPPATPSFPASNPVNIGSTCGADNLTVVTPSSMLNPAAALLPGGLCSDGSIPSITVGQGSSYLYWQCGSQVCSAQVNPASIAAATPPPALTITATPPPVASTNANGVSFYQQPTTLQGFLGNVYEVLYNRAPDASGMAFWTNYLTGAGASMATFYQDMFSSSEYASQNKSTAQFLVDAYETVFYRSPDAGGLAFWTNAINTGTSRSDTLSQMTQSSEFTTDGAGGYPAVGATINNLIASYNPNTGTGLACGSANGTSIASAISLNSSNLCSDGSVPSVAQNGTGWTWVCGASVCSANATAAAASALSAANCPGINQRIVAEGLYTGMTCAQALAQQNAFPIPLYGAVPQNIITQAISLASAPADPVGQARTSGPQGPVNTLMRICVNHGSVGPANGGTVGSGFGNDPCTISSDEAFVGSLNFDGQTIGTIGPVTNAYGTALNAPGLVFRIPSVLPDGTKVMPGLHHISVSQTANGQQVNVSPMFAITVTSDIPGCGALPFGDFSGTVVGSQSTPPCLDATVNPVSTNDGATGKLMGAVNDLYNSSVQALVFCNSADSSTYNNCKGPWTVTMDGQTIASNLSAVIGSKYIGSSGAEVDFNIPSGTSFGPHDFTLTTAYAGGQTTNAGTVFVTGRTYVMPTPITSGITTPAWTQPADGSNGLDIGCSATQPPTITGVNGTASTTATFTTGSTVTLTGNCFSAYNNTVALQVQRLSCTATNLNDGGYSYANCQELFGIGPLESPDGKTLTFTLPSGILSGMKGSILLGNNHFGINVVNAASQQVVPEPFVGYFNVR